MRELLLYDVIFPDTVEDFINKMEDAKQDDVHMRFASPGGSVLHGWGMIRKISEHRERGKKVTGIVDGMAYSMGAATLPFLNYVTAVKQAEIMLHKAVGPTDTEQERAKLNEANANLREALEKKVDQQELKNLKGMTLDQLFAPESQRVNLYMNGEEAKQIGLADETVGAGEIRKEDRGTFGIAAYKVEDDGSKKKIDPNEPTFSGSSLDSDPSKESEEQKKPYQNNSSMTLNELKQNHPELYQQLLAEAKTANGQNNGQNGQNEQHQGNGEDLAKKEQERVNAWLAWIDVDREKVMQAIKDGKEMTMADISELSQQQAKLALKQNAKEDSPEETNAEGSPEGGESQNNGGDTPEDAEAKALLHNAHPEVAKKMAEEELTGKSQVSTDDADRNAPSLEGGAGNSAEGRAATEQQKES